MLTHLMFMRHAKSSWNSSAQTDHERPLNARGQKAAPAIGAALHARGFAPEVIWSSDAKRTRETAMALIRAIPGAQSVEYIPDFYHASAQNVISVCHKMGEPDCERLMLLGHNPGWTELSKVFTGRALDMPTGACVILKRTKHSTSRQPDGKTKRATEQSHWLSPDCWTFIDFIKPRDLLL